MRRQDTLALLRFYTDCFREEPSVGDPTLTELADRLPEDASDGKVERWLGFAQGAAYEGELFTLRELMGHSRRAASGDPPGAESRPEGPVLCQGCSLALHGPAAERGWCLDCRP